MSAEKERSLTTKELFDLTTLLIGHCNDEEQLLYIIAYTKRRLRAVSSRDKPV